MGDFNCVVELLGIVQSQNNPITQIPSLYEAQLYSRLNSTLRNEDFSTENDLFSNVYVYPNTVKDKLFIKNLNTKSSLKTYNNLGQLLLEKHAVTNMNVSSLKTGLFYLVVNNKMGIKIMRFIKE